MSIALDLFVGPAVVVDDEIDKPNTAARALVAELEGANFPVLRKSSLPADGEIAHWQAMSLIILDWDLHGGVKTFEQDPDSNEHGGPPVFGVGLPDSLKSDPASDSLGFLRKLLTQLYCPVFVVSNLDPESIWRQIEEGQDEDGKREARARVLVRSKTEATGSLLAGLEEWVARHPAIYALKTWERGYEGAKAALFDDFQRSAVNWPGILWRTSSLDGVNPNHELTETISRNLFHRMNPHLFTAELVSPETEAQSLDSVRRVLHQQAVLPDERLHEDVTMPGDFFYESQQGQPPKLIDICITPACDLVARHEDPDDTRMFMVQASLVEGEALATKRALTRTLEAGDSTTSVLLHHLVPEDAMYIVKFKDWFVTNWGVKKATRRGRLLDPYVTLLQQRNAHYSQRQGLPRLPNDFYTPRPVEAPEPE